VLGGLPGRNLPLKGASRIEEGYREEEKKKAKLVFKRNPAEIEQKSKSGEKDNFFSKKKGQKEWVSLGKNEPLRQGGRGLLDPSGLVPSMPIEEKKRRRGVMGKKKGLPGFRS